MFKLIKNFFRKDSSYSKPLLNISPFQRAKQEWDERIGSARIQARNWRFMAIISNVISLTLLILLCINLLIKQNHIFIAEVTHQGHIVNISPLKILYNPTSAQKEYFIAYFIRLIRNISSDPISVRHSLLSAYNFLTTKGAKTLNSYFKKNNPVTLIGKQAVTVKILDIIPINDAKTFEAHWEETSFDLNQENKTQKEFSGIFNITIKQPSSQKEILTNPLGIYITDFSFSCKAVTAKTF